MKVCRIWFYFEEKALSQVFFVRIDSKGELFNIYWTIEQKCRKCTKIIAGYPLILMFVAAALYSIYCILTGNLDTTTWILPYKLSVPFETRTIHGWYCLWFIETQIGISYSMVMVNISTYFVCCCFYIVGICEHFDYLIHSINQIVESKDGKENASSAEKRVLNMKTTLSKAIIIHNTIFE